MKLKTIYLLAVICCISFFSAAKQSGKHCDKTANSCAQFKVKAVKPGAAKTSDKTGFDLSPLQVFVFGI